MGASPQSRHPLHEAAQVGGGKQRGAGQGQRWPESRPISPFRSDADGGEFLFHLSPSARPTGGEHRYHPAHPGLGKGARTSARGPFATGLGGDASGAEPHGLRPEYPQVGRAVQPARATCARGGPDGQHGLAPQRSGTSPVCVGKIQCARPQRLYRGERCRAPELSECPAHLLEPLLHPAQPDAL